MEHREGAAPGPIQRGPAPEESPEQAVIEEQRQPEECLRAIGEVLRVRDVAVDHQDLVGIQRGSVHRAVEDGASNLPALEQDPGVLVDAGAPTLPAGVAVVAHAVLARPATLVDVLPLRADHPAEAPEQLVLHGVEAFAVPIGRFGVGADEKPGEDTDEH